MGLKIDYLLDDQAEPLRPHPGNSASSVSKWSKLIAEMQLFSQMQWWSNFDTHLGSGCIHGSQSYHGKKFSWNNGWSLSHTSEEKGADRSERCCCINSVNSNLNPPKSDANFLPSKKSFQLFESPKSPEVNPLSGLSIPAVSRRRRIQKWFILCHDTAGYFAAEEPIAGVAMLGSALLRL